MFVYLLQVKVAVYKDGAEKFNMVFNTAGTTKMSWFSAKNLVSSSYTDIKTSPINYFSIEG